MNIFYWNIPFAARSRHLWASFEYFWLLEVFAVNFGFVMEKIGLLVLIAESILIWLLATKWTEMDKSINWINLDKSDWIWNEIESLLDQKWLKLNTKARNGIKLHNIERNRTKSNKIEKKWTKLNKIGQDWMKVYVL